MKKIILFSLLVLSAAAINAQKVFTITQDRTWNNNGVNSFPNPCQGCTFNIAKGVTLTIERDVTFSHTKFNGGTIVVTDRKFTIWRSDLGGTYMTDTRLVLNGRANFTGEVTSFTNTEIEMNNNAEMTLYSHSNFINSKLTATGSTKLVMSISMGMQNSLFTFNGTSSILINQGMNMVNSKIKLYDNSNLLSQSGLFELKENSHIIIGDGSTTSKAYASFNGPTLNLYDNSFVSISNFNNYYFNWAPFNTRVNNKSYNTAFNTYNCGTADRNKCENPKVYGPSMLNYSGVLPTAALPVTITNFTVSANKSNIAAISWSTAQESNSAYFEIQRSADGKDWIKAGTVQAQGNSTITKSYTFSDATPISGVVYYRLKMVDADGTFAYSSIRVIELSLSATVTLFPNPTADFVNISLKGNNSGNAKVYLVNQAGQIMNQKNAPRNTNIVSFDVKGYNAGLYMIRVAAENGQSETHRFIVKK